MKKMNADFAKGYKTASGLVVAILAVLLSRYTTEGELTEIAAQTGQIIGGALAVYGLVMKVIRRVRNN